MACPSISLVLRVILAATIALGGIIVLILMYHQSIPSPMCHPTPNRSKRPHRPVTLSDAKQPQSVAGTQQKDKPLMLLWFWPEDKKFDFQDCKTLFNMDGCNLADDRSLYSRAHDVLIFHRAIKDDLSNLPTSPRPRIQRWIWFNMDLPKNTRRIAGIQGLFNLTLSYRKEADIRVRWQLTHKRNTDEDFVLPKKERLLCWILDTEDLDAKSGEGYKYFQKLVTHIKVDVIHTSSGKFLNGENYFQIISSCKFYLSFENSVDRDYITETFNGPLAAGTVPIVLGPPRSNYEDLVPGSSFIHVNDFSDAAKLAEFLLTLDKDSKAYERYFDWRQFYNARRHPTEQNREFAHAICQACQDVSLKRVYRDIPDLYKGFLQ